MKLHHTTNPCLEMTYLRFLDFPVTVRDQIYTELLVPPVFQVDEHHITQGPPSTNIIYTNKQIYAESSDVFYSKNLFTVICTNSPQLLCEQPRSKMPIFAEPKDPLKVAQCHRFAMTMELLGIDQETSSKSIPAFVISARALPFFATALIGEFQFHSGIGNGFCVVRMKIENTFRYSTSRFSTLTFGRLLTAEVFPKFNCLRIEGNILDEHRRAMLCNFLNELEYACAFFGLAVDAFRHRVWFRMRNEDRENPNEGIKVEIPDAQTCELPRLLLRMYDIFWDCHDYRVRELEHECTTGTRYQFIRMADMYNTLIQGYVLAAKRHPELPERVVDAYTKALHAAEEGIAYLNREDRLMDSKILTTEADLLKVNSAKTLLSLKAAKACSKLGNEKAAGNYIEDAAIYSPDMFPTAADRLLKLHWKLWPTEPLVTTRPILWRNTEF
jgi:hypothetical protein